METVLSHDVEIGTGRTSFSSRSDVISGVRPDNAVERRFDDLGGDVFHKNYLHYLAECWGKHYGVIIDPNFLWNMVLSELALVVKRNPDRYRKEFTTSPHKEEILIPQAGGPIDTVRLLEKVKERSPTNADLFFPKFSTNTAVTELAQSATFCDMVSPFYSYSMYLCNIPKVKLEGNQSDWELFVRLLKEFITVFKDADVATYLLGVRDTVEKILGGGGTAFWKDMFRIEWCGSGHQEVVEGWITKFFLKVPHELARLRNFSTHVSRVPYKDLSAAKRYQLFSGLFSSKVEGSYLRPQFGRVVYEVS